MFTIWCAYKAYMQGELIKLASQTNKRRRAQLEALLAEIHSKENLNKTNPTLAISSALMADRLALRNLLLHKYELAAISSKAHPLPLPF